MTWNRSLLIVAMVALIGLVPFIVPANSLPPQSVLRSIPLARTHWGPVPCGKLRVALSPSALRMTVSGFTVVGYALPHRCLIVLDPYFIDTSPDWLVCELLLHEYGHVMGRFHVANVKRIMHRYVGGYHHSPCRSRLRIGDLR